MSDPALLRSIAFLTHRYLLRTSHLRARVPGRGFDMRVSTRDVIGRHIYKYGAHDPQLTRFLEDVLVLEPDDVVFDVGANIGWFSLVLAALAPVGVDIFAFEPHPANARLLAENVRRNGAHAVSVVNRAVSESDGERELFVYEGENSGRHSLLPLHGGAHVTTSAVALDGFWKAHDLGARRPGFVKLDIEGHELPALRGSRELLGRCPIVVLEYSPGLMKRAGLVPSELLDFMIGLGFACHRIVDGRRVPADRAQLLDSDRQVNLVWER